MATGKKNGNGVRETAPGKFVASMYDPRAKGKTKHIGTFTAPPQPNPQYRTRTLAKRAAEDAKREAEKLRDLQLKGEGSRGDDRILCKALGRRLPAAPGDDQPPQRGAGQGPRQGLRRPPAARRHQPAGGSGVDLRRDRPRGDPRYRRTGTSAITRPRWRRRGQEPQGPPPCGAGDVQRRGPDPALRQQPVRLAERPRGRGRRGSAITVLTESELAVLVETATTS
jgi:hypothetical protein